MPVSAARPQRAIVAHIQHRLDPVRHVGTKWRVDYGADHDMSAQKSGRLLIALSSDDLAEMGVGEDAIAQGGGTCTQVGMGVAPDAFPEAAQFGKRLVAREDARLPLR
jgi:hypothetical protein